MPEGGIVVFGATGGIGSAIVGKLAGEGRDIALVYRSSHDKAQALADLVRTKGAKAIVCQADLTKADAARAAVLQASEAIGPLRAGVYAAGPRIQVGYASKLAADEWQAAMRGDADACFNAFSALLPLLKENGPGALVAVTTTQFNRNEKRGLLSAAPKAAIEMLVRAIAKEEAVNGIRANTVRAGWVDSQGLGAEMLEQVLSAKAYRKIIGDIPMGRFGHADEIAAAVSFLLSDKASYITGQSITVDGGMAL